MSSKPVDHINSIVRRYWVVTLILVLGLVYFGYQWLISPHINSDPKRKILIRGQFPFSQGLDLKLDINFRSRNPACKHTGRAFLIFPTAEVDRRSRQIISVKREDGDHYSAEVTLDYFLPGFCDWQHDGMGYGFSGGKIGPSSMMDGMGPFPDRKKTLTYVCGYQVVSNSRTVGPTSTTYVTCDFPAMTKDTISTGSNAELNFIWKGN